MLLDFKILIFQCKSDIKVKILSFHKYLYMESEFGVKFEIILSQVSA